MAKASSKVSVYGSSLLSQAPTRIQWCEFLTVSSDIVTCKRTNNRFVTSKPSYLYEYAPV